MKKKSMILSAILVTVLAFTGCGNTQTNTSNTTSDTDGSQQSNEKVIRIGSPTTDGTQLVENAGLAYKLGYLDEELEKVGYKAEYVGFAQGGTAINEAFASGQLDVAFVGDVPEIIAKSNGLEVELFANLNSEAEMGIVAGKNSGNDIRCSFCNKTQSQVRKLIAGPAGVYICDECVDICAEIIEEENEEEPQEEDPKQINLLKPVQIKEFLDDYVIGQEAVSYTHLTLPTNSRV